MDDDIVTGSNTKVEKVSITQEQKTTKKQKMDINDDGVVDKNDRSLAGKVLAAGKKIIKKK